MINVMTVPLMMVVYPFDRAPTFCRPNGGFWFVWPLMDQALETLPSITHTTNIAIIHIHH